jgi:acyl-homoserine lactone acylase PvdQ
MRGVTAGEGEATMRALRAADTGGEPPWRVAFGSQAMRLVAFTAPIQSFTLYAFGQSDDPASPHFNDQAKLFSEKRMKPAYFEFVELEGHVASVTRLVMSGPTHQA